MEILSDLTNEQVADEITTWAGRIAAGEARLLELIAEFDRRGAWHGSGILSLAHWLSWQLGMSLPAAYERVRVARALESFPLVRAAFGAGRMSWSQVRAVTRVATAADEQTWVDLARHCTGAQLERLARGVRRAKQPAEDETDPIGAKLRRRDQVRYDPDGTLVVTLRFAAEDGAVFLAAIEAAREEIDRQRRADSSAEEPDGSLRAQPPDSSAEEHPDRPGVEASDSSAEDSGLRRTASPWGPVDSSAEERPSPATRAEGALAMARAHLEQLAATRPEATRRTRSRLVAHVDPLSGWGRLADGEILPTSSLADVITTLPGRGMPLRPLTDEDLTRLDLGRTSRTPSLALRELLGCLDGERCRFPGCTRRRKLHAHHVTEWGAGGTTDLGNLVLLCSRHHTIVHRDGFQLRLDPATRRLTVHTADGVAVLHHPALPWGNADDLDPQRQIRPETLRSEWDGSRIDWHYAVNVLCQQAA
jgi:hypothetical protein